MKTHHAAVEPLPVVQEHWGAVGAMSLCVALLIAAEFMPVSLLTPIALHWAINATGALGAAVAWRL